jgi:multimeric flavodoxin WrbA
MKIPDILLILDGDSRTDLSADVQERITEAAGARQRRVGTVELHRRDVPPCTGCFLCMTRHPGKCVFDRALARIFTHAVDHPAVVFLSPVLFGTFSSTMKNVIDRGGLIIGNHRACRQIIIGYGEDATDEERSTFIDITAKHRGKAEAVHPHLVEHVEVYFTRSREDTADICESLGSIV